MLKSLLYREFAKNGVLDYLILIMISVIGLMVPFVSFACSLMLFFILFVTIQKKKHPLVFWHNFLLLFFFLLLYYSICYYFYNNFYRIDFDEMIIKLNPIFKIGFTVVFISSYYLCGFYLSDKKNNLLFLLLPIISIAVFAVLTCLKSLVVFGLPAMLLNRVNSDIWRGTSIVATIIGIYLSLGGALLSSVFVDMKKQYKYSLLLLALLSIFSSYALQTRTPIYSAILSFSISLAFYFYNSSLKNKLKVLFWSGTITSSIVVILISINFLDADKLQFVLGRLAGQDMSQGVSKGSILATPRYELWSQTFSKMWDNPIGRLNIRFFPEAFSHNLWLDIAIFTGIIPLLFFLYFQIVHIKPIVLYVTKNRNNFFIILPIMISLLSSAMMEPLIIASPLVIAIMFYYFGLLSYSLNERKM